MKLENLLNLIRIDQQLNIYDAINNVYLHRNIFKESCSREYYSYQIVEIMIGQNDYGHPVIELDVENSGCSSFDLFQEGNVNG